MNFSKTDKMFERAAIDSAARQALIEKLKKTRKALLWIYFLAVSSLSLAAIWLAFQIIPILRSGDYASFSPSIELDPVLTFVIAGFLMFLGVIAIFAAANADNRVKMLILFDQHTQITTPKSPAEQNSGGQPATRPE